MTALYIAPGVYVPDPDDFDDYRERFTPPTVEQREAMADKMRPHNNERSET